MMAVVQAITILIKILLSYFEALFRLIVSPKPKSIKDKLVLVTGGGQGIGRALAFQFARHGANIVLWDIDQESCEQTAEDIRTATGVKVKSYVCDVSDYEGVKVTAARVRKDMGDVDVLVNNAGINFGGPIIDQTVPKIKKLFDVNVMSHVWTVKEFLPGMLTKKEGHIVGIASLAAYLPCSLCAGYCTTKFAVRGFCDSLREELQCHYNTDDIHVSVVCPGFVRTKLNRGLAEDIVLEVKEEDMMTPEYVAEQTVKRVLRNEKLIDLPSTSARVLLLCQALMPKKAQDILQHGVFGTFKTHGDH